jgi:hypothetical protein
MLRIFVFDEPFTLKLRVEGELSRASLPQFTAAISSARSNRGDRKLLIDVAGLTVADSDAEQMILRENYTDVHYIGAANRIAELLHEEEQWRCRQRCSLLRKIGFSLTEHCRESTRPLCLKLYRLLHSEG